jgi:hypothetical protein
MATSAVHEALKTSELYRAKGIEREAPQTDYQAKALQRELQTVFTRNMIALADLVRILAIR